jgi:hypothetical protein
MDKVENSVVLSVVHNENHLELTSNCYVYNLKSLEIYTSCEIGG